MKKLGPRRLLSLLFPVGKIVVFASLNHLRTLCSRLLAHPALLPKHPPKANHIVLFFRFKHHSNRFQFRFSACTMKQEEGTIWKERGPRERQK